MFTCNPQKVFARLTAVWRVWIAIHLVCVLLLARAVSADVLDSAQNAYIEGRFKASFELAESLETAPGYALAAKALTIHARYIAPVDEKKLLLEQAIELARKAIQSDPHQIDGYLWLATSMGRYAQLVSKWKATQEDYAGQIRAAIESALRIAPESSDAHVSMGRWHTGIIARIGSFLARTTFKARKKDALSHFDRALELNQLSKKNKLDIAIGLLELDKKKYKSKAQDLLAVAMQLPVKDAYGQIIHELVVEQLQVLEAS